MITSRQSKITIGSGIAGVAVGVTLLWLVQYASFKSRSVTLFQYLDAAVVIAFALTFGGLVSVLVGGVCFARREPFARNLQFSFALAAVAGCFMLPFDFNVHSWNVLLAMTLVCSEVIAGIVLVVAFATAPC